MRTEEKLFTHGIGAGLEVIIDLDHLDVLALNTLGSPGDVAAFLASAGLGG
jgi:hypothetical protein